MLMDRLSASGGGAEVQSLEEDSQPRFVLLWFQFHEGE